MILVGGSDEVIKMLLNCNEVTAVIDITCLQASRELEAVPELVPLYSHPAWHCVQKASTTFWQF